MGQVHPKSVFLVKNGTSERHHWILHTRISLSTKFPLTLTLLIFFFSFFFDQICPKRVFPVKNEKVALFFASMVVTYDIKFFRTGSDRHIHILMSLLLLVAVTINRLLSKGMSNIYLKVVTETLPKLRFSGLKKIVTRSVFVELQYIAYWIHFQNIHSFAYQKT